MKFAIVEDSRSQAAVLEALLKSEGHEVDIFADGQSCLNALIETTFDFFIIDWTLPDISGDEVLKRVREHCGWNVPVMFCTARADEESASDILRLGADDFVPKPIRYMEFMARVASLLRRRAPMTPQAARRTWPGVTGATSGGAAVGPGQCIDWQPWTRQRLA